MLTGVSSAVLSWRNKQESKGGESEKIPIPCKSRLSRCRTIFCAYHWGFLYKLMMESRLSLSDTLVESTVTYLRKGIGCEPETQICMRGVRHDVSTLDSDLFRHLTCKVSLCACNHRLCRWCPLCVYHQPAAAGSCQQRHELHWLWVVIKIRFSRFIVRANRSSKFQKGMRNHATGP